MSTEQTYFQSGAVQVTNSRVIVGSQTYAVAGITSVSFVHIKPKRYLPVAVLLAGFLLAKSNHGASIWHYAALLTPGLIWLLLQRSSYAVQLSTASGESKVLTSKKGGFIKSVVAAINDAIASRI
jgi:hypothetical protein